MHNEINFIGRLNGYFILQNRKYEEVKKGVASPVRFSVQRLMLDQECLRIREAENSYAANRINSNQMFDVLCNHDSIDNCKHSVHLIQFICINSCFAVMSDYSQYITDMQDHDFDASSDEINNILHQEEENQPSTSNVGQIRFRVGLCLYDVYKLDNIFLSVFRI